MSTVILAMPSVTGDLLRRLARGGEGEDLAFTQVELHRRRGKQQFLLVEEPAHRAAQHPAQNRRPDRRQAGAVPALQPSNVGAARLRPSIA